MHLLQELGRRRGNPFFLRAIDLRNAYDSVDCKLLWDVLTRFGGADKMIEVVLQFTTACAHACGWMTRGTWTGSTWSRACAKKDPGVHANLVHLHDPAAEGTTEGPEESKVPRAEMMRAVWGMLYADDACIVSLSSQDLAEMMAAMV